jgi:hypothetical protein
MTTFVALYRGASVGEAELVAVTADPELVLPVVDGLLVRRPRSADRVLNAKHRGQRHVLHLVRDELASHELGEDGQ